MSASFPFTYCYDCKHLLFTKDQSRYLLPNFKEVTCMYHEFVHNGECEYCCQAMGESLAARGIKYINNPEKHYLLYINANPFHI